MGVAGTLYLAIKGDTTDLKSALASAKAEATSTASSMRSSMNEYGASVVRAAGATAALAGAAGLALLTREAILSTKAASDLAETTGKFNVVFAGNETAAKAMATTLVDSYAMSTREAKGFLGSMQDLLVPMGVASDKAAELSYNSVKLAADLGSFNNLSTGQVMEDMQSAMVGNYETMKKYGVVINAASVEQKALAMGLADTKDQLTAAEKAQAAYSMIVEGSTAAIGDMERTADGFANQQKQWLAYYEDIRVVVGEAILPMATEFLTIWNDQADATLKNKDGLTTLANEGVFFVIDSLGVAVETLRFMENGWSGLQLAGATAVEGITKGLAYLFDYGLRPILAPLDAIYAGMVKLGAVESNPFDDLSEAANEFGQAAGLMTDDIIKDIEDTNTKYDSWKAKTDQLSAKARELAAVHATAQDDIQDKTEETGALQIATSDAGARVVVANEKEKVKAVDGAYQSLKFEAADYYGYMVGQLEAERAEFIRVTDDKELADQVFNEKLKALDQEYTDHLKSQTSEREGSLADYYSQVTWQDTTYREWAIDQLKAEEQASIDAGMTKEQAHALYLNNVTELEKDHTEWLKSEDGRRTAATTGPGSFLDEMGLAWQSFSDDMTGSDGLFNSMAKSWEEGESLKEVASKTAKTKIVGYAGELAQGYFDRLLPKVVEQIAAWVGLGAGQSATEGDTWGERIKNGLAFAGGIGAAFLVAKSAFADGGWIGSNPTGGLINAGSGWRDDVFLGLTDGGATANYGMGGEYVINQKSTAKYLPYIEAINQDRFAEGGPVKDPRGLANATNAGGFAAFVQKWADTGDWKAGVKDAVGYYVGALGAGVAGKLVAPSLFADGGPVRSRGFIFGGSFNPFSGDHSPLPGFAPTINEIRENPMVLLDNPVTDLLDKLPQGIGLDELSKWIWQNDAIDAMTRRMRDSVDDALIPWFSDLLTPGKMPNPAEHVGDQIDLIYQDLITDFLENPLAIYHTGIDSVPKTGPAYLDAGERVVSSAQNKDLERHMAEDTRPLMITVMVGNEEFAAYVDRRADNVRVKAHRRQLGATPMVF